MTEKIKIFCNKLKMFLDSMKHREELILKTDDSFCDMIFNHEIKIEKLHRNVGEEVYKNNIDDIIINSGFHRYEEVYMNVDNKQK